MAFDDLGVVLGAAGIATGLVSILYARTQAKAAEGQAVGTRRQAEQATYMTLLAANQTVFARLHEARNRVGRSPNVLGQLERAIPDLGPLLKAVGGWEDYMLMREVGEVFQDAYFMRRDDILTDAYWTDLAGQAVLWGSTESFRASFQFAMDRHLLHADFVDSFRPVLDGQAWRDPKRR